MCDPAKWYKGHEKKKRHIEVEEDFIESVMVRLEDGTLFRMPANTEDPDVGDALIHINYIYNALIPGDLSDQGEEKKLLQKILLRLDSRKVDKECVAKLPAWIKVIEGVIDKVDPSQ